MKISSEWNVLLAGRDICLTHQLIFPGKMFMMFTLILITMIDWKQGKKNNQTSVDIIYEKNC